MVRVDAIVRHITSLQVDVASMSSHVLIARGGGDIDRTPTLAQRRFSRQPTPQTFHLAEQAATLPGQDEEIRA